MRLPITPASGYTNPNAPGNQSAVPTKPKPLTAAEKQKQADLKMLAKLEAQLAKQRGNLAGIQKNLGVLNEQDTTSDAAANARGANDYLNLGPLGGLGAGVVAGVTGATPGAGAGAGAATLSAGLAAGASSSA